MDLRVNRAPLCRRQLITTSRTQAKIYGFLEVFVASEVQEFSLNQWLRATGTGRDRSY
jgi:hypothetical protein